MLSLWLSHIEYSDDFCVLFFSCSISLEENFAFCPLLPFFTDPPNELPAATVVRHEAKDINSEQASQTGRRTGGDRKKTNKSSRSRPLLLSRPTEHSLDLPDPDVVPIRRRRADLNSSNRSVPFSNRDTSSSTRIPLPLRRCSWTPPPIRPGSAAASPDDSANSNSNRSKKVSSK